jgi:membrane protease YdiL (CAAX protease family)
LFWQAALFALLHFLVGFSPARLAVFFPALVFGWLREKRSGIGAAIWFHALSNLLSELLIRGYL